MKTRWRPDYHFKIVTRAFRVPLEKCSRPWNRARAEIGYYVVSDELERIGFSCVHPALATCRRFLRWWKGGCWRFDCALGSMDFVLGT